MEKIHPKKLLLQKYADDNAEKLLVPIRDSRNNLIVVEYEQPNMKIVESIIQLNDITTTCNISPIPEYHRSSQINDIDTNKQLQCEPNFDGKSNKSYSIPNLPNIEVTRVSEDRDYPCGVQMCQDNDIRSQTSTPSNQSVVSPVIIDSFSLSNRNNLSSTSKQSQSEDGIRTESKKELLQARKPIKKPTNKAFPLRNKNVKVDTTASKLRTEENIKRYFIITFSIEKFQSNKMILFL